MQNRNQHPARRGVFQKNDYFHKILQKNCLIFLLLISLVGAGCASEKDGFSGMALIMDTLVEYRFYGENAAKAGQEVEQALMAFESRYSLYQKESEISKLNESAGKEAVSLSPDVYDLLKRCVAYGAESDGAFDVTVAPLTLLWGVTGDNPHVPAQADIEQILQLVNYQDIQILPDNQAMLAKEGEMVDLGGIAKGYACGVAREAALNAGIERGWLSIGGNIIVIGKKSWNQDFKFGVRDPRGGANDYIAVVTLPDSTMATSGDYERYFEEDGVRYHHIMDPATGWPVETDLMSVSVVSPDGAYADFMSTYFFIQGKAFLLEHMNQYTCGVIGIDKEKHVYVSDNLKKQFVMSDSTGGYSYKEGS